MPAPPPEQTPHLVPDPVVLRLLAPATQRLVRSVDALTNHDWTDPSGLPGWTRAHVVAHLALNAEGLAGALGGLAGGERVPMYRSDEARDADIAELAAAPVDRVRDRFLGSVTAFADAVVGVPADAWGTRLERTPGGREFVAAETPSMRLCEIEIHHADLGTSYSAGSWSPDFAAHLLGRLTGGPGEPDGFVVVATDLDRSWTIGDGGPAVSGPASALGWWLTGRGDGTGLTSEGGTLPRIGAW